VPTRAGLGGASSDAAAALVGAGAVLGLALDPEWSHDALAGLGSDCAFFAEAAATGAAVCTGRGERVDPRPPVGPWNVALLTPAAGVATAAAYGAAGIRLSPFAAGHTFPSESLGTSAVLARRRLHNQLEQAACDVEPEVGRWRRLLDDEGCDHWRLCGSGSSFFGLYDDADEARSSLDRIRRAAGSRSLALRGSWITRPARHGVRFLSES
jgi:4-diphosphocytidyl-2-C-methyl-D-erythritol kinase